MAGRTCSLPVALVGTRSPQCTITLLAAASITDGCRAGLQHRLLASAHAAICPLDDVRTLAILAPGPPPTHHTR